MSEIDKAFDDLFLAEENFVKCGYRKGFEEGKFDQEQKFEGFKHGINKVIELSKQLGDYYGFACIWSNKLASQEILYQKELKLLTELKKLTSQNFDKNNLDQIPLVLASAKNKYNQLCSLLRLPINQRGVWEENKGEELSF